jgi:hypothetical protein
LIFCGLCLVLARATPAGLGLTTYVLLHVDVERWGTVRSCPNPTTLLVFLP